jgi:hypothetical protein
MKKQVITLALGLCTFLFASAQTTVSIRDIQYVSPSDLASCKDLSAYDGVVVKTIGVVMHDGGLTEVSSGSVTGGYRPGVHIMDTAANGVMGNFAGIQIHGVYAAQNSQPVTALNNLVAGMIVEIIGTVNNFSGETQIYPTDNSSVTVKGTTSVPVPKVIDLGLLNDNARANKYESGEEYEGSLVTIENVTVIGVTIFSGNRVSFDVSDGNGNLINISDRFIAQKQSSWAVKNAASPVSAGSFVPPIVGTNYESLTGIVLHSENGCSGGTGRGYELNPFKSTHYKVGDTPPSITEVTRMPLVPASANTAKITARIVDFNGTVSSQNLYYSTDINQANTSFTAVPMTLKSGSTDEFEGTIPAFPNGTIVRYYITATDNDANKSYLPFSASNATGATSFYTVRDNGLTIVDLQKVLNPLQDASPYRDQTVTVKGYVTASSKSYDLEDIYIQDKDATEYAAIKLTGNADLLELWRTEEVEVTGKVVESFGYTQMEVTSVSKTGKTFEIAPIELPVSDSAGRADNGMEKYESMLVKLVNTGGKVKISNPRFNPFGEWTVANDTGASFSNSTKVQTGVKNNNNNSSLWVSIVSNDTFANVDGIMEVPAIEATKAMDMDAIVGIVYYGFSQYALKPRNNDDIMGFSQKLDSTKYASDTATNAVVDLKVLGVSFYPNPTYDILTINVQNAATGSLAIRSLEGRQVAHNQIVGTTKLDVSSLISGVYFLEYTNAAGQRATAKFVKL